MNKDQKLILYICTFLTFLFLVLSILLEPIHYRFKKYTDRDDVAAYIYKYRELPSNYIKKEDNPYQTTKAALENGYSFGGNIFDYKGEITKYTKNEDLREADYYPNLEENLAKNYYEPGMGPRDKYRLVYTVGKERQIFYTEDHYDTFVEINVARRFTPCKVMKAFFYISYSGVVIVIAQHQISLNRRRKDERENN